MVRDGMQELKALHHCVYALHYHLVLVTKYRRKALSAEMIERIGSLTRERCAAWGGSLLEANGEADHVHLLIELPPTVVLSDFVNALKTNTSRVLRRDFGKKLTRHFSKPVLWSRSYCVISCGGAPLEVLKRYIQSQDAPTSHQDGLEGARGAS